MNLPLNNRTEEIALKIPKKYRNIILNSIIARSIENNIFIQEISLYFSTEEIEEIMNELNIKFSIKKEKPIKRQRYRVNSEINKKEKEEKETSELFFGFDE